MKPLKLIIAIFLSAFLSNFLFAQSDAEIAVKECYSKYKTAILNDKGEKAARYVDSNTFAYYDKILKLVKSADSISVEKLSLVDKLAVLGIRHKTPREDILKFDGKALLIYSVNNGGAGKNGVTNTSLGDVTVDGDFAKGEVLNKGKKTSTFMHFYKQDNNWKIDLTALFPLTNVAFKKVIKESGESENDFIFILLESLTGKKPGLEIWQPVQ